MNKKEQIGLTIRQYNGNEISLAVAVETLFQLIDKAPSYKFNNGDEVEVKDHHEGDHFWRVRKFAVNIAGDTYCYSDKDENMLFRWEEIRFPIKHNVTMDEMIDEYCKSKGISKQNLIIHE